MVKNPPAKAEDIRDAALIPWVRKILWRRAWQPTPVFLPGESHGQTILTGYSPWGRKETRLRQLSTQHNEQEAEGSIKKVVVKDTFLLKYIFSVSTKCITEHLRWKENTG